VREQPAREVVRLENQLALSERELEEELARTLTAGNPAAPANIVRFRHAGRPPLGGRQSGRQANGVSVRSLCVWMICIYVRHCCMLPLCLACALWLLALLTPLP